MLYTSVFLGFVMTTSAVVLTGAASPVEPPSQKSCTALVTLFNKRFADESQVSHLPLTYDPRFAIRALVNEVIAGACPFSPKDRAIFLIHSPSLTFGGYWFHNKQFYVTLEGSRTGRQWTLAGIDWPLTTMPPRPEYLVCSAGSQVVRVLVGNSNQMIGPLTVFQGGRPVVSLSTEEVARAGLQRGVEAFTVEFSGDPERFLKPAFRFSAAGKQGTLSIGSNKSKLLCKWPHGDR
jgi:hypothetical protein